jgi:hypothetical protein
MRPSFFLAVFSALSLLKASAGDDKTVAPSTLRSATIYRSGAELTHTATVHLDRGNNDVIIGDLSSSIDANSLRIRCSSNVTIMSVSVSSDHLRSGPVGPLVRQLEDSLAAIKKEQTRLDVLTASDTELLDLLNSNKSIGSTTGGVTVADLAKMLDYYRSQVLQLRTELSTYNERTQKLKELSGRLESQIKEDQKKNASTTGNIVLQLLSPMAGPCNLTISYLTLAAHWDPSYDLKVNSSTEPLHILYKARVVQTTGLDWKQVKLSLSTSMPTQGGNAPVLKTWFLQFLSPITGYSAGDMLKGKVAGLQIRGTNSLSEVVVTGYSGRAEAPEYTEPLYIVNGKEVARSEYDKIDKRVIKSISELKGMDATALYGSRGGPGVFIVTLKDELSDFVSINDHQMDVVFDIDIPYDVPGNGKEQGVALKDWQMPCAYQYYAAPGRDKDAFLLGQITGWEKLNLLPGEASIMVEGTYIGKSQIDPGSTQDTLNLTLGRDKRIVVKKEKVSEFSSMKFLGSNKKEVFTWQITVRNNKKEKVTMLLKDQYPISSNKDIEEELLDSGGAAVNKDTGILTWNLELAPGESRSYRISYSVKYPKDKVLNIN